MATLTEAQELRHGRQWQAAYDAYAALPERTADVVEGHADSAWWLGRMDESIRLYAEAYRLHVEADDLDRAAYLAVLLAICTRLVGEGSQSAGWLGRAQRILDTIPECAVHGYPLYLGTAALLGGDLDTALASALHMQALGRRHHDPTLVAIGVYYEGRVLIRQARVAEGLALLDESMVAALSDQLSPLWTGAIYCGLMDTCHELSDLRRASEWTEATRRWSEPLPLSSLYPGICRVHRAQVLQRHGDWAQAEREALGACRDMVGVDVFAVADAYYEVGEVRRLRGDLAGAEQAYDQAHEHSRDPQPGIALLRLAQGRAPEAAASVAAALAAAGGSRLERAPLRAAQVDIAVAAGDLELAESSAREIAETAETFDSPGLRAEGWRCHGSVLLAQGRTAEALGALRTGLNAWNQLDVPFEAARTRLLLSQAYAAFGDADAAGREETAAQACFAKLGVTVARPSGGAGLTAREVEVLRLVASGKSNRDIADALILSHKTVARHLSNIFVKTGTSSRAAATAFAYDRGLMDRKTHD